MRQLTLTEYATTPGVELTFEQRDQLLRVGRLQSIVPTSGCDGHYDLTPGSHVGAIALGDLAITIRPKLLVERVLFLIAYALDRTRWEETCVGLAERGDLLETIVPVFVSRVRCALRQGLLRGYRVDEDCLNTVRGRIRFDDQIRNRFGICPPIEVRYDEFTEDILENRLLRSAVARLRRLRIRSPEANHVLRSLDSALAAVTLTDFDSRSIPSVMYTRLNEHYRPAVELARLILRNTSFDLEHGGVQASTFLVDMNQVFEDFVVVAMRDCLNTTDSAFPQGAAGRQLHLDAACRIRLRPDISWWMGSECVFVGDVKYKRIEDREIKHADLYQLLAYCVATPLPRGILIYAAGADVEPVTHRVRFLDKELEVALLDLSVPPKQVLAQVARLCRRVKAWQKQQICHLRSEILAKY